MKTEGAVKATIYLPILLPFFAEKSFYKKTLKNITEVGQMDCLTCKPNGYKKEQHVTINSIKDLPQKFHKRYYASFGDRISTKLPKRWLKFSYSCPLNFSDWDLNDWKHVEAGGNERSLFASEIKDMQKHLIIEALKDILNFLCVIVNIARPGHYRPDEGFITLDGKPYGNTDSQFSPFSFNEQLENLPDWPKILDLDLQEVWAWVKQYSGFFEGQSTTRVCRTLNAFSYLFHDQLARSEELDLLWSMVGLEAQYIRDNSPKSEQLIKNSAILIGSTPQSEKQIKKMYDFRSRFLHGQKDLQNQFADRDDRLKFNDEFGKTVDLATMMLLATIQQIFKKEYLVS